MGVGKRVLNSITYYLGQSVRWGTAVEWMTAVARGSTAGTADVAVGSAVLMYHEAVVMEMSMVLQTKTHHARTSGMERWTEVLLMMKHPAWVRPWVTSSPWPQSVR